MDIGIAEVFNGSYEEIFRGFSIYIESNPDHYYGGFAWSVCRNENELECGLSNTPEDALSEAREAIENTGVIHSPLLV